MKSFLQDRILRSKTISLVNGLSSLNISLLSTFFELFFGFEELNKESILDK